ncbi:DUF4262 domain-containing protein [Streptomyces sp. NPDC059122]|uniref:DUF4262 domain-containing protein n=1 Tax=Streptomyces sp. NPDC059122 TaxID=3346732 RepID=UPI0036AFC983
MRCSDSISRRCTCCLTPSVTRLRPGLCWRGGRECHGIIEDRPVVLKAADLRWYREFFGRAISFYRRPPFPVLQAVWPDVDGHFLWQPGVDEQHQQSQPQLWLKPAEHPPGVWTALVTG